MVPNYKLQFVETFGEFSFALDEHLKAYVISLNGERFCVRQITKAETKEQALAKAKAALSFVGPLRSTEWNGLIGYRYFYGISQEQPILPDCICGCECHLAGVRCY